MADKPLTKKDLESVIQKVTIQNKTSVKIDNASDIAKPLVEESKKNDLKRLEANIEQRSLFEGMFNGIRSIGENIADGFSELGKSLKQKGANALKFLGIALGAAAALILAPVFAAGAFFKQLSVELKFLDSLTKGRLGKIFAPVTKFFARIGNFLKGKLGNVFKPISNLFTRIGAFFKKGPFGKLVKLFKSVTRIFKGSGGIIRMFNPAIKGFKAGFATVRKFAKLFGTVAGKLFLPITIAMTVFDGIKGFLQGFRESDGESMLGKITDGLYGALGEIVANLVGVPLDLLKSSVGWILGKFGFEDAKESLAAFSFKDMIKDLITGVGDLVQGVVDYVVNLFKNPKEAFAGMAESLGNIGDMASDFARSILRNFLPVYDESRTGGKFNPLNVAHRLTPAALYKFAGIDKKSGALIPREEIKTDISGGNLNGSGMDDLSTGGSAPIVVMVPAAQSSAPASSQGNVSLNPTTIMVNDNSRSIKASRRASRGRRGARMTDDDF